MGLSYTACGVSVKVTSYRHGQPVDGSYTLVEWHNRPDNMMTAREEIGYAALWADIDLTPRRLLIHRAGGVERVPVSRDEAR